MLHAWKLQHLIKGIFTWVPAINRLRQKRASTSGSDSARYCYSVWLRHVSILAAHGFQVKGAAVGELGPGDSIGIGLAALLSGARSYIGLDIVPFSARADLKTIFDELVNLYTKSEAIPNEQEFPFVHPTLSSYDFPTHLVDCEDLLNRVETIRRELTSKLSGETVLNYKAPWNSSEVITPGSIDLVFSQAVLEHVDDLETTYSAMGAWLRTGGYASHVIDFGAHNLAPFWDGHRAYTDREWRLVRGQREFLLNRQPLSSHLWLAGKARFEVLQVIRYEGSTCMPAELMAPRFQTLSPTDRRTKGCVLILRKRG